MNRYISAVLADRLARFPCVVLRGARQSGKRALIRDVLPGWTCVDLEKLVDYQAVARDPDLFLQLHRGQVIFHESQLLPALLPALSRAIDREPTRMGRFLLSESVMPKLPEALVGRIEVVEMGPLTLAEATALPLASLYRLLGAGVSIDALTILPVRIPSDRIGDYWMWGGYPGAQTDNTTVTDPAAQLLDILQTCLDRTLAHQSPPFGRETFRQFLLMLGQLSGDIVNYAAVARTLGISQPTAHAYFRIVQDSFLWRVLPAYEGETTRRIIKHPKGHLCDSGLLHCLLQLQNSDQLMTHPRMVQSWQGMVIENLLRGLAAADVACHAWHYRTGAGATIDLVLEGTFGLLPVNIQHTRQVAPRSLRALRSFVTEHSCRYGIVINNNETPQRLDEQLVSLPLALL